MSKSWWIFMKENIWDRKVVCEQIKENHLQNWKQARYEKRMIRTFSGPDVSIHSLCCDGYLVVAGFDNELVQAFNIKTGAFKF
jgi:hypothetical protein